MAYPYDSGVIDNWVGSMPNYQQNYSGMLGQMSTPLSLGRLVSLARDVQEGFGNQNFGRQPVNVSPTPLNQVPAEIAQAIMGQQQRLLSLPRSRWSQPTEEIVTPPTPGPGGGSATPGAPARAPASSGGGDPFIGGGGHTNITAHALNPNFHSPSSSPSSIATPPISGGNYTGTIYNPFGSGSASPWSSSSPSNFTGGGGGGFSGGGGGFKW